MKKTVIISTNDNPDYCKYLPYVQAAWELIGWDTLCFWFGDNPPESTNKHRIVDITNKQSPYRPETHVQVIRLLAHNYVKEGLIMTSDADMLPLSNYWQPTPDKFTVYGYDLTGFSEYPICYIVAPVELWRQVMPEKSLEELLKQYHNAATSDDFYTWWCIDQQLITSRIKARVELPVSQVPRTKTSYPGADLAYGRIDRFNWQLTKDSVKDPIDAHMPRPFNQEAAEYCLDLLKSNL